MKDNLKERQAAGERVEEQMISFLLQFNPAGELSIGDAKRIAMAARQYAFEQFSNIANET